jgi:sugar phosphate isomerase/epimerase
MSARQITDLSQLCIHTITTKPWSIEEAAKYYSAEGVKGITVWRDALADRNIKQAGQLLRDHGLNIVSLCRGGFFPNKEKQKRKLAIEDNLNAIEEAAELGTSLLFSSAVPIQLNHSKIQEGKYKRVFKLFFRGQRLPE